MKDPRNEHAEKVALFRYGLIADVLQPAPEDGRKLYERLAEKASRTYCIPASRRTTVAVETLRDWISLYKAGGFDALKPKPRKDIGSARAIPTEVLDLLVATKDLRERVRRGLPGRPRARSAMDIAAPPHGS